MPGRPRAALPGRVPVPVVLQAGDALALLSSNALALAQAALAQGEAGMLLRATHAVAALSLVAVSGSPEAYAAPVHALRPYPGAAHAAGEVRRLLGLPGRPSSRPGGRVQDPFAFRAFPQVHGCALDASERLREIVEVEIEKGAACAGKRVEQLSLPDGARLISVMRDGTAEIAVGATTLEPGDQVLAILEPGKEDELRKLMLKR